MTIPDIDSEVRKNLDIAKNTTSSGELYWRARDLQEVLEYSEWRSFKEVLNKAREACTSTGNDVGDHFVRSHKMVSTGEHSERVVEDFILSRLACYLVAMNGQSSKPKIAAAQRYFAVQTIRMEQVDKAASATDRVEMRDKVTEANKSLMEAAKCAGVTRYGLFNDAGYRGMYGLSLKEIQERKNIGKDKLLDRAGHSELAANYFRITQTDEKIRRDKVQGENNASLTHHDVGKRIRDTIRAIGGTMPEDLPAEVNIQNLPEYKEAKRIASSKKPPSEL